MNECYVVVGHSEPLAHCRGDKAEDKDRMRQVNWRGKTVWFCPRHYQILVESSQYGSGKDRKE